MSDKANQDANAIIEMIETRVANGTLNQDKFLLYVRALVSTVRYLQEQLAKSEESKCQD